MTEQTVTHQHQHSDPKPELRIKVEKRQRNTYAWEVSAPGHDVDALLAVIGEADVRLRERYSEPSEPFGPRAAEAARRGEIYAGSHRVSRDFRISRDAGCWTYP